MSDIGLLKLFLAIAEQGSIAAGARASNMTPSIASRNLAKLEQQLQVRLMHRSTRALTLTETGRLFQERSRAIVERYDQMVDQLAFEQGSLVGHITIAVNDLMGQTLMPIVLSHFREHHRGLTFSVILTDEPLQSLRQNCDFAVHAGSSPGANLVGRRVYSYERILCGAPGYLARKGVPSRPVDLDQHDCMVHTQNDRRAWHFLSPDGSHTAQVIDPVIEANSYAGLINYARQDLGLIRIGRALVERQLAAGSLQLLMSDYKCIESDGTDPTIWLTYPDKVMLSRVRLVADYMYSVMRKTVTSPDWWTSVIGDVTR